MTLVTNKARREDTLQALPQCLCSKTLLRGSCKNGSCLPYPLQQGPGDQMDGAKAEGLNDTPLLAPVLMLTIDSDTPPLAPGKPVSSK